MSKFFKIFLASIIILILIVVGATTFLVKKCGSIGDERVLNDMRIGGPFRVIHFGSNVYLCYF